MSKFYFDENTQNTVCVPLVATTAEAFALSMKLKTVKSNLSVFCGFGIENIISLLEQEIKEFNSCIGTIKNGAAVLSEINELVKKYEESAVLIDSSVLRYIGNHTVNDRFVNVFDKYYGTTSSYTDKYCNNVSTVVGQIKTAFMKTFSDGSYEKYLIQDILKDIISRSAGDFEIQNPFKDRFERIDDAETLMGAFDDKYPSNPLSKLNKEVNFNIDVLNTLVNDYDNNMQYLNSLERSLKASGFDNATVSEVMAKIRQDYDNKYLKVLKDMGKYAAKSLTTKAIELNPIGKTVMTMLDLSELADKNSDDKLKFASLSIYEHDMLNAYQNLGKKISAGNYVAQDLIDFQNMFEICKNMEIKKYSTALNFVDSLDYSDSKEALEYYQNLSLN